MEVSTTDVAVTELRARIAELETENNEMSDEILRLDRVIVDMNDEADSLYEELQDEREENEALSTELDVAQDELRDAGLLDELDEVELSDMAADLEDFPLDGEDC